MSEPGHSPRRARLAVATLFFVNGAAFANVVPRLPDVRADLGLSNSSLGLSIAAYPAGALVLGLLGGVLVGRFGSRRVAPLSAAGVAANLVLIGAAPTWAALTVTLFVAGALDAVADVANNAHGLRVERRYGRPLLTSLHALWSIGAVLGGITGAAASQATLPVAAHGAAAGGVLVVLALGVRRLLLPGGDGEERAARRHDVPAGRTRATARRVGLLVALGFVAAAAQLMEDTTATWSALYLRGDLATSAALGGAGFVALQAMQTVGRLAGDRAVARFGDRAVARGGTALAGGAMTCALALPSAALTIAAFGAVGLGIGTLIPAAIRAGHAVPGVRPGLGIAVVATISRIVSLLTPPLVGVVADAHGLRIALVAVPLAAGVALVLSGALPFPRDHARRP